MKFFRSNQFVRRSANASISLTSNRHDSYRLLLHYGNWLNKSMIIAQMQEISAQMQNVKELYRANQY